MEKEFVKEKTEKIVQKQKCLISQREKETSNCEMKTDKLIISPLKNIRK